MKKNHETESSLELLLDTMCNTFGGVMFIAIALIVVLSISSKISTPETEETKEISPQRLEELQAELEKLKKSSVTHEKLLDVQQDDLSSDLLKDVAILEAQMQEQEETLKEKQKELQEAQKKQSTAQNAVEQARQEVQQNRQLTQEEIARKEKLEEQIKHLQEELKKVVTGHIAFKTLAATDKDPYFLIVYKNRIWRIGPVVIGADKDRTHSDVKAERAGGRVTCTINPAKPGTPLLRNGRISPEAEKLLQDIPSNRFPSFSIHSNSAADFFVFREEVKKRNIPHSIDVSFETQNESFSYYYTDGPVKHETY